MSRSPQQTRLEQQESLAHNGKLPELSCHPELQPIVSQLSEEQKMPALTSDRRYLDKKVLGKPYGSFSFEYSWKTAVRKTKKIKQEYTSAYGLRETNKNTAMPSLTRGFERCLAVSNPSPAVQKAKGATNSYPVSITFKSDAVDHSLNAIPNLASSCIKEDYKCLPPLYLLPSTSSQFFDSFYKSRGDIAIDSIHRSEPCPWKPGSLKSPGVHGGAGEGGAERLKKHNQCTSLISFPEGSKFKSGKGYLFTDPVRGAPPQYVQRLSQLAALECETIHHEKHRKVRRTRKHNIK